MWRKGFKFHLTLYGIIAILNGIRKTPTRKIPTHQVPPGKFTPGKFSPRKFPPWIFPLMFSNIATHICNFLVFLLLSTLSLILLKRLFRDSFLKMVKSDLLQCIQKFCSLQAVYLSEEVKTVVKSWIIV